MGTTREEAVTSICEDHGNDRHRMMDIALAVQRRFDCVDGASVGIIAAALDVPRVEIDQLVSFYAFLSAEPKGRVVIRLCNDVIDEMKGSREVAAALEDELGIAFGETTPDGKISLEYASCIGMSDQAPAALVNDVVLTQLRPGAGREIVRTLRRQEHPADLRKLLLKSYGDGNNAHDLIRAEVNNNLRLRGGVVFGAMEPGAALRRALAMSPAEVIRAIKTSRLRGRGGAGFPTGMKWEYTRTANGDQAYLICNADEGEPGTFKDRVVLTENPDLVFEGMAVGAYAIGADQGLVYLRAEYRYLLDYLEHVLARRREAGLLGKEICGKQGFDFDIRIQMGAGAYICGEETALIHSCAGRHGDPLNRPPFPAQSGYLGKPTSVNNVETLCCAARILEKGPGWFSSMGTARSSGTKLLSISGDCNRPGVYEMPLGVRLSDVFASCGADDVVAAQIGGPSGQMIGPEDFERSICFDDLATGGAIMVFGPGRDLLGVVSKFMEFFIHESCGYCTPCRVGNVLLKERVDRILAGRGEASDLDHLLELGNTVKLASRCGLGQASPHPVLSTLRSFRGEYERRLIESIDGDQPGFDIEKSLQHARQLTGREA